MKTYFKVVALLVALLMAGQVGRAAEAARMQNYDRWKDLPSQTLINKGDDYWRADKIDSALVCFVIVSNKYSDKLTEREKKLSCTATLAVANLYLNYFYDYQTALRYLLKAKEIATDNNIGQVLADIEESMAILQAGRIELESNYSNSPEIIELFKKSFSLAFKNHRFQTACLSFGNLAYAAMKYGHVREIGNELEVFHTLKIPDDFAFKAYFQKLCDGIMAYRNGRYQEALDIIKQLEHLLPQNESPQSIANDLSMVHIFKYVVLLSLNRDKEALQELDKAESIARNNNLQNAVVEYLRMKQDYYETHGNADLANEYKLKYFEAKDEFINRSKLLSVEQQKFLIELEEMGEEVKDLEAQKRMRELVIAGIAVLALLVIAALIYLWRNYLNTKQRNLILYQKNQELLALEQERNMPVEKYKSSPMDEQAKDELLQRIHHVMENHDEIYDEGFTLDQLAGLIDANPNYVSQVINEKKGCNFKAFINDYKIKEACRRLSDPDKYSTYTIEAIGQSVGFGSRTHFYTIFKKATGMTPAAYQRIAREKAPGQ
jgi:AraC-like DNA-binding protein